MTTESAEEQIRTEFYNLVHHRFGGDLQIVESALSKHPNRKASLRTIQSWLVKGEKPSRRTCPAWAPDLLRSYLEEHTDSVELGRARQDRDRTNIHLAGYGSRFADTAGVHENAIADHRIAEKTELASKLASASLGELPEVYAAEIIHLRRELQSLSHHLSCLIETIEKSDEDTSVYDLKKSLKGELLNLTAGQITLQNAERDVVKKRSEFSSVDGTLSKTN